MLRLRPATIEALAEARALAEALARAEGRPTRRAASVNRVLFEALTNYRRRLRFHRCPAAGVDVPAVLERVRAERAERAAARAAGITLTAYRKQAAAAAPPSAPEAPARIPPDLKNSGPRVDRV